MMEKMGMVFSPHVPIALACSLRKCSPIASRFIDLFLSVVVVNPANNRAVKPGVVTSTTIKLQRYCRGRVVCCPSQADCDCAAVHATRNVTRTLTLVKFSRR